MSTSPAPVCFVDTETTALDRDVRQIWEVALISPNHEGGPSRESVWQLPVDLSQADPMSLAMNGFHERRCPERELMDLSQFAREFAALTRGAILAGACVSLDEHTLWDLLRLYGECPMWSHRLLCVETLAAGWTRVMPDGLAKMAARVGVGVDESVRHSALGDARLAEAIYLAVMGA